MKWARSIRFRLMIWYSLVLAAALVLFAVAIWLSMRHSLLLDLDHGLREQVARVGQFINSELRDHSATLSEELAEYSGGLPDGMYLQVLDARGVPVYSSLRPFPWPRKGEKVPDHLQTRWHGDVYQLLSEPVQIGQQQWQINLAASLRTINQLTRRLGMLLVALIPAVALIAAFGGTWLSRRALKPVDEITAAARSIGIANLSERLRVPDSNDELQRLSETWNDMLSRLEDAVTRLSQFTSDASHELRTPLAVIRTTAELALRRSRSPESYQTALTQVLSEAERMSHLVDDLLFLARCDSDSQEMPMTHVNFAALVGMLCSQIVPLAEGRQIHLNAEIQSENVVVLGNGLALRRLVLALLDNAIKYSKQPGTVLVRVWETQDTAMLEVQDQGPGIAGSELSLIFNRFYRTSEAREVSTEGYGLGLSLAAAIAGKHRGRIDVESAVQAGSTFRVLIPLARAA